MPSCPPWVYWWMAALPDSFCSVAHLEHLCLCSWTSEGNQTFFCHRDCMIEPLSGTVIYFLGLNKTHLNCVPETQTAASR